jgi:DMSO/TMAO reductase YedYZ molybdopterin-dependent catalytic subunit
MEKRGLDRRRFLALAATGSVLPGAVAAAFGSTRRLLQRNGYPTDAETPLDLLTDYVTPNDLFFVRHHWNPVEVDPATWSLTVDGEVDRPLRVTLAELRAMPAASATCVLQCAGNGRGLQTPPVPGVQWKYGAVGNARWTGVRVRDLLERAGVRASAGHVHTFGSDTPPGKVPPFHRSVEIGKLAADGIVAYEMNGERLLHPHGAPARLVVPGWAGDHWMKWLVRLSPQPAPQTGFYMETAYRYPKSPGAPGAPVKPEDTVPVTELFVKSNFTRVPSAARVGRAVEIGGFAFSGAPDVARVEVSEDAGETWKIAALDSRHDPFAWRLWTFRWTPSRAGGATLVCRATDSRGVVQPKEAAWNPSGYLQNGWHAVTVPVSA